MALILSEVGNVTSKCIGVTGYCYGHALRVKVKKVAELMSFTITFLHSDEALCDNFKT
jgi:hypothetical protein